jgi:hypothetical protein
MTSLLEFNARAALCRHFARLEPDSRYIWLAEAERWARLTKENGDEPEAREKPFATKVDARLTADCAGQMR